MPEQQPEVTDVINCTIKMDTTLNAFDQEGGADMFENNMARGLGVNRNNVQVQDVR